MPCGASSTASARVSPSTAAFVVSYCPMPARPSTPNTEETLTIVPRPAVRSRGMAAFAQNAVPSTLTSTMRAQSSAVASASGVYTRMPATLTRAWSAPRRPTVSSTARRASASRATSAASGSTCAPGTAAVMPAAAASAAAPSTSTSATAPPSSANSRAVASPMPPPPPVTRATRPVMRPGMAASGARQCLVVAHEHERPRGGDPVLVGLQHQRGRAHAEGARVAARRPLAALAQRPGGGHEPAAHLDDGGVARAQALHGAVDDRALALLDRLVLHPEPRDAAEHPRAVRLPVHEVVVVAVGGGADVAVRLGGRRRVVAD